MINNNNQIIFSLILTIISWKSVLIKEVNWQLSQSLRGHLCHYDHVQSGGGCLTGNFWGPARFGVMESTNLPNAFLKSFYLSGCQLGSISYSYPFPFLQIQILELEFLPRMKESMRVNFIIWPRSQVLLELDLDVNIRSKNYTTETIHVDMKV